MGPLLADTRNNDVNYDILTSVLMECDNFLDEEIKLKSKQRVAELEELRHSRSVLRNNQNTQKTCTIDEEQSVHAKCVLVGDDLVGKSSLARAIAFGKFSSHYVPTAQENYLLSVSETGSTANGAPIATGNHSLNICDLGGQDDMDRLRPLCYDKSNILIICFSVVIPSSFSNVTTKWMPELKRYCNNFKELSILLVGTQSDLRSNWNVLCKLSEKGLSPITENKALRLARKIRAKSYIECSSLTMKNTREVFEMAFSYCSSVGQDRVKIVGLMTESTTTEVSKSPGIAPAISNEIVNKENVYSAQPTASNSHSCSDRAKEDARVTTKSRHFRLLRNKTAKLKRLIFLKCLFR